MKYIDYVYGEVEITEPVILELFNSKAVQRLKHIDQIGYRPLWVDPHINIPEYEESRFAHSVGVYILLHNYGAPLEEQIAGLLHDVSHSAFSHCIDYILDDGNGREQDHQDNNHNAFVKNSDIPEILDRYGYDIDYILDDKHFPLKENNLPDICADRIDYSFRTAVLFKVISQEEARECLSNLVTENNIWFFKDFEWAKKYAELFLKMNTAFYSGIKSAIMFRAVGDCLKYSLDAGYISYQDLYTTDQEVIRKVRKHIVSDHKLANLWARMNNQIKAKNDKDDYVSEVFCKSRVVNPLFRENNVLQRLSDKNKNWSEIVIKESTPKHYYLKFEK